MAFHLYLEALLFVLGAWWCKEIVGRFRADVADLKDPDTVRRMVILGIWIITLVIVVLMVRFAWDLATPGIQAFSHR